MPLSAPSDALRDCRYEARLHGAATTEHYVFRHLLPYLGNKRKLLPLIGRAIEATGVQSGTFADVFAGTGVVSRFAKRAGFRVLANDWEPYAAPLLRAWVALNAVPPFDGLGGPQAAFDALNDLPPLDTDGYVTRHLCPAQDDAPDPDTERMFFTRANGQRIDAIREALEAWRAKGRLTEDEGAVCLASLLYAVSYAANTSGVFKGFHRGWGGRTGTALYRIRGDLRLAPPVFWDNGQANEAWGLDAQAFAERLRAEGRAVDVAYLDPPYNQHPYGSNYHVLNTVAVWDKPPVPPYDGGAGKSAIRTDWRTARRSAYNHAKTALEAYEALLHALPARFILTSYSTDGRMPLDGLLRAASGRGRLSVVCQDYKRYRVSSQRQSPRPRTTEFVLIVDTARAGEPGDVARALGEIDGELPAAEATGRTDGTPFGAEDAPAMACSAAPKGVPPV